MQQDMTVGKPAKLISNFMWPIFIGNVFQQLYNMVDSMIVGRFVSSDALAAVGSTGTFMFLVFGTANGLANGFTVLTSQRYGDHDEDGTRKSVGTGVVLSVIVILVMTALSLLLMRTILTWLNTPENIFEDAYTYSFIICVGIVVSVANNYFGACLRAVGNNKVPLYTLILSAFLNLVLDLIFIINLHLGVAGAAWATVIAQGIAATLCALYIWKKEVCLRPKTEEIRLDAACVKQELTVGVPMALQSAITASGAMTMQSAINLFGSDAIAGYTAANKLISILMQGHQALGQTMATYSGQNFGAKEYGRIRQGVKAAFVIGRSYSIIAGLIGYFSLPFLLRFFFESGTDLTNILFYARRYTLLSVLFFISLSNAYICYNTMQGCGYSMFQMMGGVVELVARFVCARVAVHFMNYSIAVFCDPFAWFVAGFFTLYCYLRVILWIEKKAKANEEIGVLPHTEEDLKARHLALQEKIKNRRK